MKNLLYEPAEAAKLSGQSMSAVPDVNQQLSLPPPLPEQQL
jgi:hypothetical protein